MNKNIFSQNGNKISAVIIEHEDDLRGELMYVLGKSERCVLEGAFASAEDALEVFDSLQPDAALVNIFLPGMSGIDFIREMKPLCPRTQFLIFTDLDDDENIFNALRAGAAGYLLKTTRPEKVLDALLDVCRGGSPMSSEIVRRVVSSFHAPAEKEFDLSKREKEIFDLLARGFRYREIADKLFICMDTVRTHVQSIYHKLNVKSRTEAVNKVSGRGRHHAHLAGVR